MCICKTVAKILGVEKVKKVVDETDMWEVPGTRRRYYAVSEQAWNDLCLEEQDEAWAEAIRSVHPAMRDYINEDRWREDNQEPYNKYYGSRDGIVVYAP